MNAHVIENLTHLLRFDERQPSLLAGAALARKPMEPIVLELIAAWLDEQRRIGQPTRLASTGFPALAGG